MTENELYHHGVLGMKWGVRRYQNKDGTLTEAGQKRYSKYVAKKQNKIDNEFFSKRRSKHDKKLRDEILDTEQTKNFVLNNNKLKKLRSATKKLNSMESRHGDFYPKLDRLREEAHEKAYNSFGPKDRQKLDTILNKADYNSPLYGSYIKELRKNQDANGFTKMNKQFTDAYDTYYKLKKDYEKEVDNYVSDFLGKYADTPAKGMNSWHGNTGRTAIDEVLKEYANYIDYDFDKRKEGYK